MSAPQTAQLIPMEIPTLGFNSLDSIARMDPRYSPYLINAESNGQTVDVRKGVSVQYDGSAALDYPYFNLYSFNSKLLLVANITGGNSAIYDVTNAGITAKETFASQIAVTYINHFEHGGYTYLLPTTGTATLCNSFGRYSADGATWSAWPFTYDPGTGAAKQAGVCGCSFKGRAYIFINQLMYYGGLSSISGALTQQDLSTIITDKGNIVWCGVLSSPGQRADEQLLCFGTHTGGIYVYGGNNPGDASWGLIARFKVSAPLWATRRPALEINNDIWILSESGIVSVRNLFRNDSFLSEQYTISGRINKYLQKFIQTGNKALAIDGITPDHPALYADMVYDENKQRVYIFLEGYVDPITLDSYDSYNYSTPTSFFDGVTLLSYDLNTKGWSVIIIPSDTEVTDYGSGYLTYVKGSLYYTVGTSVMKFGPGNLTAASWGTEAYRDEKWDSPTTYQAIKYYIHGAYSNLGSPNKNKAVQGFELAFNTDLSVGSVTVRAAADFNRTYSAADSVNFVTAQYGDTIAYYPVGVQGSYIQWRLEGSANSSSATKGLTLYSVAAAVT